MRRTKEEAQQTRERILDAAESVFFSRGVAATSLDQVAKAAEVTRGAVYWHFANKIDLFNAMVDRAHTPMEKALLKVTTESEDLDDLERLSLNKFLEVVDNDHLRQVYSVLLLKCEYTEGLTALLERDTATKQTIQTALESFFTRLQASGQVTTAIPPRVMSLTLHAFMLGLYRNFLHFPDHYRLPDDPRNMIAAMFAAFRVEKKPQAA